MPRSIGALIVYDVTRKDSFENVSRWIRETNEYANEKMVKILIGNKNDLSHKYFLDFNGLNDFWGIDEK